MNYEFPKLSFGKVMSHIFPGFIFLTEFITLIYLFRGGNMAGFLNKIIKLDWNTQMFLFLCSIFLGTICGVIIDAIHHFIFEKIDDINERWFKKKSKKFSEVFSLSTKDEVDIYRYWVDEEFLYYYEGYINTCIALMPLFIIFWKISLPVISSIILFIILLILFREAVVTRNEYYDEHERVMKYFQQREK